MNGKRKSPLRQPKKAPAWLARERDICLDLPGPKQIKGGLTVKLGFVMKILSIL
jgi:hypothetical protein